MQEKDFIIEVGDSRISGDYTVPDNYNKKTVILAHGFSNDRHQRGQFDDLRDVLLKKGYAVLWFDFPGPAGKSSGLFENTTIERHKEILGNIIGYSSSLSFVDINSLYLVAMSFCSVVAAVLNSNKIKKMIFIGFNFDPHKIISNIFGNNFNLNGVSERTNAAGDRLRLNADFWKSLEDVNLIEDIKKIKTPLLFIHGDKDITAPYKDAKKFYIDHIGGNNFITIKGASHNFDESDNIRAEMIKSIINWF